MPHKGKHADWSPEAKAKHRGYVARWHDAHKDQLNASKRRRNSEEKRAVLDAYGGVCACCGEDEIVFLSIDHIHGGGRKDRINGQLGTHFYIKLRKDGYPAGFQVLCYNCNFAKRYRETCPHADIVRRRLRLL